jgi:hypothetical protein
MAETKTLIARTPNNERIAVPVVDLDGTAGEARQGGEQQVAGGAVPSLSGALDAVRDFAAGFQQALDAVTPRKATVEFSMSFAMQAGKIVALFADAKAEGAVKVTLEWGPQE